MTQTKIRTQQFQKEASYDIHVVVDVPEITTIATVADVSGNLSSKYFTVSSSTTDYYVWMNIQALSEITDIITVADVSSSLNSKYFTISSPTTDYYVWYSDGGGVDPAPGGTAIPITFTTDDTADTIASLTQTAITGLPDFSASVITNTVTVTNAATGDVTNAADTDTTFTVTVSTQGVNASTDPAPAGTAIPIGFNINDTADTIASNIQSAVNLLVDFAASSIGSNVTITSDGDTTDASDNDTTFTIATTQQGIDNDTFTTNFNFSTPSAGAATLLIFVNGLKQIEGATHDYIATAPNTVVFNIPALAGEVIEFYGLG